MTNSSLPSLQKHTLSDPANHTMVTWIVWRELSDEGNSTYKASIHDDSLDLLLVGFLGQDLKLTHDMLLFNGEWAPENICGLARAGEPEAEAEQAQRLMDVFDDDLDLWRESATGCKSIPKKLVLSREVNITFACPAGTAVVNQARRCSPLS
ncbi:hypothetical protein KHW15_14250 [Pseudomonas syringae]|uniref:hypothetical protein n=1 Tax=Pseudomonas syringae TaxID=317 RepID=UPI000BB5D51F|nr:hypothetical protein [Pseudomonas syringae]MBI6783663.1 hypothetical protein [Pseudomonas syringae]MBS7415553.1 hypothetical protein [Pseudomonas syringae]MBS7431707.1 hypothetical protein [Pseudomonas syringae]PBP53868.1 hypothetical protein CCL10_16295 [Pseudomonas syringae]QVI78198.1 hypothetical protein KHW15_14250 [Pseudomonas syringae]